MKKIIFLIFFIHNVYGNFILSAFLEKVDKIKSIEILYENNKGKKDVKKVKLNNILSGNVIVFSEAKQSTFLKSIKLKMPTNINSINIYYLDKNNEDKEKFINISSENRIIKNNILYFYENIDYIYNFDNLLIKNIPPLNKKTKNILKTSLMKTKSKFNFKKVDKHESLKIFYDENEKYFYLKIQGCETNGICIEPTYAKSDDNKKIIFKFKFKHNHSQALENDTFSKFIKRIEVGYHSGEVGNNHLVIESKSKKISDVRRIQLGKNKMVNKQLVYRIEFE